MTRAPELVAVVNSLNRCELLQGAIESLAAALQKMSIPTAIVVFDAGSTDGSVAWLEAYRQTQASTRIDLMYADSGSPTSIAAGINRGAEFAQTQYPSLQWRSEERRVGKESSDG